MSPSLPQPAHQEWLDLKDAVWGKPNTWITPHQTLSGHHAEVLELGVPGAKPIRTELSIPPGTRALVRREYYELLELIKINARAQGSSLSSNGLVIIGQPGIGKTVFLAYALVKLLGEKQITAFHFSPKMYIVFDEHGVTEWRSHKKMIGYEGHSIIGLSNSSQSVHTPADGLQHTEECYVVQATSPLESRWHGFMKEQGAQRTFMDLWDASELIELARLRAWDTEKVMEAAARYGPAPRTISFALKDVEDVETSIAEAVNKLELTGTAFFSSMLRTSTGSASSSTIFWIRPVDEMAPHPRRRYEITLPTVYISSLVTDFLSSQDEAVRFKYLKAVSTIGSAPSRSLTGYLFEVEIHIYFSNGGELSVTWCPKAGETLPTLTSYVPSSPSRMVIRELDELTEHCNKSTLKEVEPFYWRPISATFPSIDAALYAEGIVYVIQVAIAWEHGSITDGSKTGWRSLKKALSHLVDHLGAKVTCVYLVDDAEKGTNLCDKDKEKKHVLGYCDFSAKMRTNLDRFKKKAMVAPRCFILPDNVE